MSSPRSLKQRKQIAWFHSTCIPVSLYLKLETSYDKLYHGAAQRFMDYCRRFEINLWITDIPNSAEKSPDYVNLVGSNVMDLTSQLNVESAATQNPPDRNKTIDLKYHHVGLDPAVGDKAERWRAHGSRRQPQTLYLFLLVYKFMGNVSAPISHPATRTLHTSVSISAHIHRLSWHSLGGAHTRKGHFSFMRQSALISLVWLYQVQLHCF